MPDETRKLSAPGPDPHSAADEPHPTSDSDSGKLLPPTPKEARASSVSLSQLNINVPPPQVWHGLPAQVRGQLLGKIIDNADRVEERKFQFAMAVSKRRREGAWVGGSVAVVGLGLCGYLASLGMNTEVTALVVFLATIIGVAIGNRIGS